jgi:hypothetical protein
MKWIDFVQPTDSEARQIVQRILRTRGKEQRSAKTSLDQSLAHPQAHEEGPRW